MRAALALGLVLGFAAAAHAQVGELPELDEPKPYSVDGFIELRPAAFWFDLQASLYALRFPTGNGARAGQLNARVQGDLSYRNLRRRSLVDAFIPREKAAAQRIKQGIMRVIDDAVFILDPVATFTGGQDSARPWAAAANTPRRRGPSRLGRGPPRPLDLGLPGAAHAPPRDWGWVKPSPLPLALIAKRPYTAPAMVSLPPSPPIRGSYNL